MNTTNMVCPLGCSAWWIACLIWLVVGSALLWATWNHVLGTVSKLKPVKYWQALLFLVTVMVLCGPARMMMHHGCEHGMCKHSDGGCSKCHHGEGETEAGKPAAAETK